MLACASPALAQTGSKQDSVSLSDAEYQAIAADVCDCMETKFAKLPTQEVAEMSDKQVQRMAKLSNKCMYENPTLKRIKKERGRATVWGLIPKLQRRLRTECPPIFRKLKAGTKRMKEQRRQQRQQDGQ
jgi:hypothetical protein